MLHQFLSIDRIGALEERRNSFVLVHSGEGEDCLWIAEVLHLLQMHATVDKDCRNYAFLQQMWVMCPIDTVSESFGCVSVQYSGDDEVDHRLWGHSGAVLQ